MRSDLKEAKPKVRTVTILVNNRAVEMPRGTATGLEIKQAADVPIDFKLYDPHGREVGDDETIHLHERMRFTAISGQDVS
jgi:hypothetical protein